MYLQVSAAGLILLAIALMLAPTVVLRVMLSVVLRLVGARLPAGEVADVRLQLELLRSGQRAYAQRYPSRLAFLRAGGVPMLALAVCLLVALGYR